MKRLFPLLSVLFFSAVVLVYLWWGRFQYQHEIYLVFTYVVCFAIVVGSHFYSRADIKELGFRLDNWKQSLVWYGGFSLVVGLAIIAAGAASGSLGAPDWTDLLEYFAWAGAQQYLLQNFLRRQVLNCIVDWKKFREYPNIALITASKIAAALFAVFHAPEISLIVLTFIGAVFWCLLFSSTPNIYAAWFSQVLIGSLLILFFKQGALEQFQVGHPGFRYDGYGEGVQVAAGYDKLLNPIIVTLPGPIPSNHANIRVFNPNGELITDWRAYEEYGYSGRIAIGDLGFGPGDEIAICPGPGPTNPAKVRIFDLDGDLLHQFSPRYIEGRYGCWPAIRNGLVYLSPGPGPDVDPKVFEMSPQGETLRSWKLELPDFSNSVKSVLVNLALAGDPEKRAERIIAWATSVAQNPAKVVLWDPDQERASEFETVPTTFGASATLVRLEKGRTGIAVGPGPLQGYPAWIRVFSLEPSVQMVSDIAPYEVPNSCGVNLSAVDINGDGIDELVIGEGTGPNRPPVVRLCSLEGEILTEWKAF